jgi:hypothetical protein
MAMAEAVGNGFIDTQTYESMLGKIGLAAESKWD